MDQRNVLIAFVLSMLILVGWGELFPQSKGVAVDTTTHTDSTASENQVSASKDTVPELRPTGGDVSSVDEPVEAGVQKQSQVFYLASDKLRVGMDDRGWLTEAELLSYTESLEPDAKRVRVLHTGEGHNVYVNVGVLGHKRVTPFQHISSSTTAHSKTSVFQATLDNGKLWQRILTVEQGTYILNVEDRILQGAGLKIFRQVVERNPDKKKNTFYEHMGAVGLLNGELQEPDYDDLDETPVKLASTGGWTGMMDRYFIAALIGQPKHDYRYYYKGDGRSYQAGVLDDGVAQDGNAVFKSKLYIGPKYIPEMATLGVGLERSVDFGWFAFIAKPMHSFMTWMYQYVHNFGWCIILLVIMIKIVFFYPTQKAYSSMARMRKIKPDMDRLREQYGDDRQRMGQEMMKLYKKHKVNPMGGCLPILIQIPVFFSLYKVLLISIEMRQAPFIGWIHDLSVQDPYFILPVLMGISMFVQQKFNPQPTEPMQAKVMQFLPPVFTIMFLFFPSGLVLYWVVNNTLTIVQQWYVTKKLDAL